MMRKTIMIGLSAAVSVRSGLQRSKPAAVIRVGRQRERRVGTLWQLRSYAGPLETQRYSVCPFCRVHRSCESRLPLVV